MATERKVVHVHGDMIEIHWDGNMWVSPCNGRQHSSARDAMRAELERYYTDCGEDVEDEATADEIEGYLSRMTTPEALARKAKRAELKRRQSRVD